MKSEKKLASIGLLTAISASLCCITPVLALLAGTSGLASTFSWLEPLRPYLIGITILVLAFAWYKKLKPKTDTNCNCEKNEKSSFIQSKKFLGIVTIFAGLMLAFPMYAQIFYPKAKAMNTTTEQSNKQQKTFKIEGMTCSSCEEEVSYEVNKLTGIIKTNVSYEKGIAIVEFDSTKTNQQEIKSAITKTGYTVDN